MWPIVMRRGEAQRAGPPTRFAGVGSAARMLSRARAAVGLFKARNPVACCGGAVAGEAGGSHFPNCWDARPCQEPLSRDHAGERPRRRIVSRRSWPAISTPRLVGLCQLAAGPAGLFLAEALEQGLCRLGCRRRRLFGAERALAGSGGACGSPAPPPWPALRPRATLWRPRPLTAPNASIRSSGLRSHSRAGTTAGMRWAATWPRRPAASRARSRRSRDRQLGQRACNFAFFDARPNGQLSVGHAEPPILRAAVLQVLGGQAHERAHRREA